MRPFTEAPGRSVVVVDFDGTLAPIVDDPATARPVAGATGVLARLAGRLGTVAVVSGRPVAFLAGVLPVEGVILVGQYGLERLEGGVVTVDPAVHAYAPAVAAAAEEASNALPRLTIERKGEIALTLHWRMAPALEAEARALGERLAARHGLAAQAGRLALELRPPLPVDKGTALADLVSGAHAALAAGDDRGDLPFFAVLDHLVAEGRLGHALRVAVRSAEAPAELLARADHVAAGPAEVVSLLGRLAP